ncbi:MAG TPA: glycosyltransferase family 4 protein [Actinomycetota bacterium]|nr:glycosyltransferase family 4 protein [Actinomycetota bacterium]
MTAPAQSPSVRVAFVSSHARLGGAERVLETLVEALGPAWEAGMVALEEGPFARRLDARGHRVEVVPAGRRGVDVAVAARRLRPVLRRMTPQVVHANGVKAALVTVLARPGAPVMWMKHDFARDGWQARWIARRCAAVVGVSGAVLETFGGRLGGRAAVIHNGLRLPATDRAAGRAALLAAMGHPEPSAVVALVGRVDPFKGHRELLEIATTLRGSVPGVAFAFVGAEDPAHPGTVAALRRRAAELGVADAVRFLGYRDDAVDLIAGADVLTVPSVPDASGMGREGFPLVAIEALAAGTPVIAYAHGGVPELVGDCGRLVPPGDRRHLLAALVEVLTDAALRERLSLCGRARARDAFSVEHMAGAMAARYRAVAAGGMLP